MLVKCKFIKVEANYWEINSKDKKIYAAAKNRNKIEAIRKIVNEYGNIIFVSSFKDVANQFAYELKNIQAIDGDSKIEERDEVVKSFNDKFIKIIITEIFENLPIVDIGALRGWYYMAIEIRTATYNDIVNIADCRMEFMSEVSGDEMTCEFRATTIEYLKKHIDSDSLVCFLAIENGKIISTVVLCVYYVIPNLHNDTGKVGYIFNVYTLKEYRGQKLAKELMRRTIESAKRTGVKKIYLNAEEKAIPLYKTLEFECVDREMALKLH